MLPELKAQFSKSDCASTAAWLAHAVKRAPVCWAGGPRFKQGQNQKSGFQKLRTMCCLCNDICKRLDLLVFSDKDEKPYVPSHSTFTYVVLGGT